MFGVLKKGVGRPNQAERRSRASQNFNNTDDIE
jgi:hypothetical protein